MDSNKIKNLAFGARDELRKEVASRIESVLAEDSPERLDNPTKVADLERSIDEKGIDSVVESSAYTWFNRLCALRFMDARGYTPVPAVTPRPGSTQPAVLADAAQGVFDPDYGFSRLVRDRVQSVLVGGSAARANRSDAAYSELLIAICGRYSAAMPYLFGETAASSLAMPQNLLAEGSILRRIVADMDDDACESVEVLGWLYQFYVAERKDEFNESKRKATAEDIAPATQLFTPNWIVRYLVENSLGRLWVLNNPGSSLSEKMDYYIAPEGDVEDFIKVYSPEELTVCDPACGSGHILVYAFDLLFEIYLEEGYIPEDIPELILRNNLYGMEIDGRAAEIAKFALEMKARGKDPLFFNKEIDANVTVLESVAFEPEELSGCGSLSTKTELLDIFAHMNEIGSLYVPSSGDIEAVNKATRALTDEGDMLQANVRTRLETMREMLEALSKRFDCVVTNPPYLGSGKFNSFMSDWTKEYYSDEKSDLCTCFIRRGFSLAKERGYSSMVTMQSWMTFSSFEAMRKFISGNKYISSMAHLGPRAFEQISGEVVQVCATVFWNHFYDARGAYVRLVDFANSREKEVALREAARDKSCVWRYDAQQSGFALIPGSPIIYYLGAGILEAFANSKRLSDYSIPRKGLGTGNKHLFMRLWWEPANNNIFYDCKSRDEALESKCRWFPHNKGGEFRKWYGNNDYVVDWSNDGAAIKAYRNDKGDLAGYARNQDCYFRECITWSKVSGMLAFRYKQAGSIFNEAGPGIFCDYQMLLRLQGFLNSSTCFAIAKALSPSLDFQVGQVSDYPIYPEVISNQDAVNVVARCIELSKADWDAFETSWDFEWNPLAPSAQEHSEQLSYGIHSEDRRKWVTLISERFKRWNRDCNYRFEQLKESEETLNRIFARIYRVEGEVPIEVSDGKVSVRKADLDRDIRALVSYGVGCIMGRYSIYSPGLILADGGQTLEDFDAKVPNAGFRPDEDAIVPILDGEWFHDDVVSQFRKWLEDTYGKETLEENISFIEEALGKDLRTYFVKDFYKDHCATYQVTGSGKRPIYWLFSSPKGSFSALVYMHRYTPSTVGQILTKYLREYIAKLNSSISVLELSDRAADGRLADKYRASVRELEEWERDVVYPLANERVSIDLDDGVKKNYNKFPHALAKVSGLSEWK